MYFLLGDVSIAKLTKIKHRASIPAITFLVSKSTIFLHVQIKLVTKRKKFSVGFGCERKCFTKNKSVNQFLPYVLLFYGQPENKFWLTSIFHCPTNTSKCGKYFLKISFGQTKHIPNLPFIRAP